MKLKRRRRMGPTVYHDAVVTMPMLCNPSAPAMEADTSMRLHFGVWSASRRTLVNELEQAITEETND